MDATSHLPPLFSAADRRDLEDVLRDLTDALGPTLVAAMAGVADREAPARWAVGDGPAPTAEAATNLLVAHQVWRDISAIDGGDVARAWFLGANPNLGDDSPVTAIREGRHREVAAAGRTFLES